MHVTPYKILTPYHYSSSEEDTPEIDTTYVQAPLSLDVIPEVRGELPKIVSKSSPKKIAENAKMLSLDEAKNLLISTDDKYHFHYLHSIKVEYVEIMKILKLLQISTSNIPASLQSLDKSELASPKEIVSNISREINHIFAHFRKYSYNDDVKNRKEILNQIKCFYSSLMINYGYLENICQFAKSQKIWGFYFQLKPHLDIIFHLSNNKDFLEIGLLTYSGYQSIERTFENYGFSSSKLDFCMNSLDAAHYATELYKIEMTICMNPIHTGIQNLKNMQEIPPGLKAFILDIEKFENDVKMDVLLTAYRKAISDTKNHVNIIPLRKCFQKLDLKVNYLFSLSEEMSTLFQGFSKSINIFTDKSQFFREFNLNNIVKSQAQCVNSLKEFKLKVTKKNVPTASVRSKILNEINVIQKRLDSDTFKEIIDCYYTDSLQLFQAFDEVQDFFRAMQDYNKAWAPFREKLTESIPFRICPSFTAIDIYSYNILKYAFDNLESRTDSLVGFCVWLPLIFNYISLSYTDSIILKQNYDCDQACNKCIECLQRLSETLHLTIDCKDTIKVVNSLDNILSSDIPPEQIVKLLYAPLNTEERIDARNEIIVKNYFLFLQTLNINNPENFYFNIKCSLKETIKKTAKKESFFWRLCHKHIELDQYLHHAIKKMINKFLPKIQETTDPVDFLKLLEKWNRESIKIESVNSGSSNSIEILHEAMKKTGNQEIALAIDRVNSWHEIFNFINSNIINFLDYQPITFATEKPILKSPIIKTQPEILLDVDSDVPDSEADEQEDSASLALSEILQTPVQIGQESLYTSQINLVNRLKLQCLKPLDKETTNSYCFRMVNRQQAFNVVQFYLAMNEEAATLNDGEHEIPQLLKTRQQLDNLLLLESTEKIGLCTLDIGIKDHPNEHIASAMTKKRPLLYTHNGGLFVKMLQIAGKDWLGAAELIPLIEKQKEQLTKAYWFKKEPGALDDCSHVRTACEDVWKKIELVPSSSSALCTEGNNYKVLKNRLHKSRRKEISTVLPSLTGNSAELKLKLDKFISSIPFDPQCDRVVHNTNAAIRRVINLHESLESCAVAQQAPLFYCVRSAEIQVSLLSLIMQVVLSAHKVDYNTKHPLFMDDLLGNEGRPLVKTHRVDKLYRVLKEKLGRNYDDQTLALLDEYLPLFVGDPRYPYPNKTAVTDDLVKMHQKVHLQKKLREGGFLTEKEQKMLKKHVGKAGKGQPLDVQEIILNKSISEMMHKQQQKTAFAFHLAEKLLECRLLV